MTDFVQLLTLRLLEFHVGAIYHAAFLCMCGFSVVVLLRHLPVLVECRCHVDIEPLELREVFF
ncbi:hypothetical protein BU25DRAFT_412882 [Macroventuria anomochaeta]|uniref:Uncharacterized protein n=1 Tax=Macroventuria anomochaeta TaxID=301207 RepID=A0ACB6RSW0_9PLEO|nr:uncharacterized protein BU25DRAFT_412882 [Macroventuria anomochaeta]KAF2625070.1 hypothetical protein BU25DRAFT_412882 [Macroventuria anomochaeta]